MHRKYRQDKQPSRYTSQIFTSVWLESTEIMRASDKMALFVALRESFLKSPSKIRATQWALQWYEFLSKLTVVHPNSVQNTELHVIISIYVRFEVFMEMTMQETVFWDLAPCIFG
jgi:hypothetical protein